MNGFAVEQELRETTEGELADLKVSVKDGICVKGMQSAASSAILKGHKPLFTATAVQRLLDKGATVIGKTVQDEFGFGSFCQNVGEGFQAPTNPHDDTRVTGGSSGGCAAAVAQLGDDHISIGESTGGSIVCPAAYCKVVGLCPTYGRVSRYGLIDYANSMDKIGPLAKSVKQCAKILSIIAGYDENDPTSLQAPVENYEEYCGKGVKGLKVGIIKESKDVDEGVKETFEATIATLKDKGAIVEEVSLPLTYTYGIEAYYILALSEASTNLSKYCGIRYGASEPLEGNFNEYFAKVRGQHFGKEVKRRILLGTFARMSGYRDAYYMKALKVRTKIIEEYKALFKQYDVLISPTMPNHPPKIEDINTLTPLEQYMMDVLTVGPNIAGMPHISVPMGEGLPKGCLIIGDHLQEGKIIQVAHELYN